MRRNPKQEGSCLFDCIPQSGKCPQGCNQCFFNRNFYCDTPAIPKASSLPPGAIVRMNTGHDSNIQKDFVLEVAKQYPEVFFNTSIPNFDFPGPVVWTANPSEEREALLIEIPGNVMFIRLRVSSTNLRQIEKAVNHYDVPIVLTFMAYYEEPPETAISDNETKNYEYKVRHINNYWCPKDSFIKRVMDYFRGNRRVHLCGKWCRDCRNCETFYWQTKRKLECT